MLLVASAGVLCYPDNVMVGGVELKLCRCYPVLVVCWLFAGCTGGVMVVSCWSGDVLLVCLWCTGFCPVEILVNWCCPSGTRVGYLLYASGGAVVLSWW